MCSSTVNGAPANGDVRAGFPPQFAGAAPFRRAEVPAGGPPPVAAAAGLGAARQALSDSLRRAPRFRSREASWKGRGRPSGVRAPGAMPRASAWSSAALLGVKLASQVDELGD